MHPNLTRRQCVTLIPLTGAALIARSTHAGQPAVAPPISDSFPAQDPGLVRDIVGSSHRSIERVAALLKDAPQLANAAYDWGFGDWETALGAASHTGRREIASLLLDHGARPDIFAAAMLGQLDVVKAMIAARPGLQKTRGPHGLTLLHHARAGGEDAAPVVEFLTTLGDADIPYPETPLTPEQFVTYVGDYSYGPRDNQRFTILRPEKQDRLAIQRGPASPLRLFHLGNHTFHPAGAIDVRIVCEVENGRTTRVVVTTPAALVVAVRD